jgi:Ca2+-binding EF-hand superfamily protein
MTNLILQPVSAAPAQSQRHLAVELSEQQLGLIKEVFDLFDTEGLGRLNEAEFASAIRAMGFSSHHHRRMAKDLMRRVDVDGDCSITLDEFTSLMEGQLTGRDPEEEINATFAAFVRGTGVVGITAQRLAQVAREVGVKLEEAELAGMFADADTDGSGDVSKEEYVHILKHSTWF